MCIRYMLYTHILKNSYPIRALLGLWEASKLWASAATRIIAEKYDAFI